MFEERGHINPVGLFPSVQGGPRGPATLGISPGSK